MSNNVSFPCTEEFLILPTEVTLKNMGDIICNVPNHKKTQQSDLIHKSHNAPVPYPTVHHFVTEMCTFLLQNGTLWDICLMHCGICEMGLLQTMCNTWGSAVRQTKLIQVQSNINVVS